MKKVSRGEDVFRMGIGAVKMKLVESTQTHSC